jgi:hypothetical protein
VRKARVSPKEGYEKQPIRGIDEISSALVFAINYVDFRTAHQGF